MSFSTAIQPVLKGRDLTSKTSPQTHNETVPCPSHRNFHCDNIPKLSEILDDTIDPECRYSKINFVKFLVDKHCIENYEFFTELTSIINNYQSFKKYNSTMEWFSIYNQFIETDIINLPEKIVLMLSKNYLPDLKLLKDIEKLILNYLHNSYHEFISRISREISHSTNSSRVSSSVNSNENNLYYHTPDTNSVGSLKNNNDLAFCYGNNQRTVSVDLNNKEILDKLNRELSDEYSFSFNTDEEDDLVFEESKEGENNDDFASSSNIELIDTNNLTIKSESSKLSSSSTAKTNPSSSVGSYKQAESILNSGKSWSRFTKKLKWGRSSRD